MRYIGIFFLLAFVSGVKAQENPIWGEDNILHVNDVLANLEKAYPIVLVAENALSIAEYSILEAQGAFDAQWNVKTASNLTGYYRNNHVDTYVVKPTPLWGLEFFAGYRHGAGDFAVYDGKKDTLSGGEVRAGARVPVLRDRSIDKMRAELSKAQIDKKLALLNLEKLRIDVNRIAVQRYWRWLAAGLEYQVADGLLMIAQDRTLQIQQRVTLGDLPEIENTDNDRAIRNRESLTISARRKFEKASLDLALLLRRPDGSMIVPGIDNLPDEIPTPNLPSILINDEINTALRNRPELKEYVYKKDKTDLDKSIGENLLMPQIDLIIAGSQMLGEGSNPRTSPEFSANVVVQVPIERNLPNGLIGQAESRKRQLVFEEGFQRDKISIEVRDAWSAMKAAKETWLAQSAALILTRELETAERDRFDLGDSSMLFVNLREQQTAEAAVKEINARLYYHAAVADFNAARGTFTLAE